jgi:long-chain fatty acid transport protein
VSDEGNKKGSAMKRFSGTLWPSLAVLAGLCFFETGFANNGMTPHGYGTKNKAMGGAGMALPGEAAAVINNPAVAVAVGGQMQAGFSVYHPRANYYTTESSNKGENGAFTIGPNDIEAEKKYRFQPYFATSAMLQENSAVAVAMYSRSGMNTAYQGGTATFDPDGDGPQPVQTFPGTLGDGDTNWSTTEVLLDMSYARQLSEKVSLGVTGVLATRSFKANGLGSLAPLTETFASSGGSVMPDSLTGNRNDWAYGAGIKVGLHSQLSRSFSFGLMYQSKIYMGKHRKYSDLLPDSGKFDMPANLKIGVTWKALDNLAFSIDAERIFHSGVDALSNTLDDLFRCPTANRDGTDLTACLGGKNGGGLGWSNMNIYKIGGSWGVSDKWTLYAGFSVTDQPIKDSETTNNLLTPYLAEAHYTLGFSRTIGDHAEVNFSAAYSEEESQISVNRFDTTQDLKIESDQFDFELSYSWRF